MKYDYDLICIGLGPAGMAVSIMGSEMGLNVCAIEKEKIGGECMNVGCIPSKSLLSVAEYRHGFTKLKEMGLVNGEPATVTSPFAKIADYLEFINSKKTVKMFDKVKLMLREGNAEFVDSHTVNVGEKTITAQRIFIATGTEPMHLPVEGMDTIDLLTNLNIFKQEDCPKSLTIIGGGAIGCEMAQAFSRLGTKCTIVQMDEFLVPNGDKKAGDILKEVFAKEGIDVFNSKKITRVANEGKLVALYTEDGLCVKSEKLLVAAGRKVVLDGLNLEKAGVNYGKQGIEVDDKYRTSTKHIYAVGDCNGGVMLSHVAMHQGMFALMNAVSPFSLFRYKKFVIPWTVFTEPQISCVGMRESELKQKGISYETHRVNYGDYGAAIAEHVEVGFVEVFCSSLGKVYGATIVGDGSGEMINEWALIIQKKIKLYSILFLAHSFPTMGFLTKRIAETWMMKKMESAFLKKMCCFFYRSM